MRERGPVTPLSIVDRQGRQTRPIRREDQVRLKAINPDLRFVWNRAKGAYEILQEIDGCLAWVYTVLEDPETKELVDAFDPRGVPANIDERVFRVLRDPNTSWNPRKDNEDPQDKADRKERFLAEEEAQIRDKAEAEDRYYGRHNVDLFQHLLLKREMRTCDVPAEMREAYDEQITAERTTINVVDKRRIRDDKEHGQDQGQEAH